MERQERSIGGAARAPDGSWGLIDVRINSAERSELTCVSPGQHGALWRLDNCYSDYAVTNARQLADLLRGAHGSVVSPSG
jgi:hypothetical protein